MGFSLIKMSKRALKIEKKISSGFLNERKFLKNHYFLFFIEKKKLDREENI